MWGLQIKRAVRSRATIDHAKAVISVLVLSATVAVCPIFGQNTQILGTARLVLLQSDVVFNKNQTSGNKPIPLAYIYQSGLMRSFKEVLSNPDIIIKFHKDVFLIDYEKVSITVFDPEDNSVVYTEERKLVDEENDVNRLVAHFLAKVKNERGILAEAAAEAKKARALELENERDRKALNDAKVVLTLYSGSESLIRSIVNANRNEPNECHIYLREVTRIDDADVVLEEKTEKGTYTLILRSRDTAELLHSERTPENLSKRAVTAMSKWITSTNWESGDTPQEDRKPSLDSATAYSYQLQQAIADRGLSNRVQVTARANTITLTGKLHPAEHASLLKFMRDTPVNVRVIDDILYDDTRIASAEITDNGAHPVPGEGRSALHVVTDVLFANAALFSPAGRKLFECQTPCSFNNLDPAEYSLQIHKDGYVAIQTALQLHANETQDQKLHLEADAKGLLVNSHPTNADVFVNGIKQPGQTPVTLPLSPGQYDVVIRLNGYEPYSSHVQVRENNQTAMEVELMERNNVHVAWAQVRSTPAGAEIFVDGEPTNQVTPARVQIPSGSHIIALQLNGYQVAKHMVQASEGGTVGVTETLHSK